MASRKRKPTRKKNRARVPSQSVAGLREATSRWADGSDAVLAAGEDRESQPVLPSNRAAARDDLDDEFFSQPITFHHAVAVGGEPDAFVDLDPPTEHSWLTPAMKARRKKLRAVVAGVVGAAATVLVLGLAKHSIQAHGPDTTAFASQQVEAPPAASAPARPSQRTSAAKQTDQRQRRR